MNRQILSLALLPASLADWVPAALVDGLVQLKSRIDDQEHPFTLNEQIGFSWIPTLLCDSRVCAAKIFLSTSKSLTVDLVTLSVPAPHAGELALDALLEVEGSLVVKPGKAEVGVGEKIDPRSCLEEYLFRTAPHPRWAHTANVGISLAEDDNTRSFRQFENQTVFFSLHSNEVLMPDQAFRAWKNHPSNQLVTKAFPQIAIETDNAASIHIHPNMYFDSNQGLIRIGPSKTPNQWVIGVGLLKGYQIEFRKSTSSISICKLVDPPVSPPTWYDRVLGWRRTRNDSASSTDSATQAHA